MLESRLPVFDTLKRELTAAAFAPPQKPWAPGASPGCPATTRAHAPRSSDYAKAMSNGRTQVSVPAGLPWHWQWSTAVAPHF